MFLKEDVIVHGLSPEILLAIMVADEVYRKQGVELVVTSLLDSVHSHTSLHYAGNAVDLRTRNLVGDGRDPRALAQHVTAELKKRLTKDYDVVLESDHIHLEYQPRRR